MSDRSRSRSPEPAAEAAAEAPAPQLASSEVQGEEIKLYLGNLSYDTDEARIEEKFREAGKVVEVFLPLDRQSGRVRGFGFCTMANKGDADKAISMFDNSELDGRNIRVNESRPKGQQGPGGVGNFNSTGSAEVKMYVGNLSFDTTVESLKELFSQYGTISDAFLPTDRETGNTRGFGFVTMPAAEAKIACEKANGAQLDGRDIRVNEAQPKKQDRFDNGGGGGWGNGGGGGGYGGDRGGYGGGGGGYNGGYNGGGGGGYNGGGGYGGDRGGGGGYNGGGGGGYGGDRGGGGGYGGNGGGGGGYGGDRGGGGGGYNGGGGGGYNGGGGGGYGGDRY